MRWWRDPRVHPAMKALLESSRAVQPVSDAVRERVVERARAYVADAPAVLASRAAPLISAPRSWPRIAAAAAAFLALVAAGAVAALRGHVPLQQDVAPRPSSPAVTPPAARAPAVRSPSLPTVEEMAPATEPPATEPLTSPPRPRESYAAELRLLRHANLAYARGDFPGALKALAEHSRRFPKGRLAEERDALRVRSLVGSGRTSEARRAADAFGRRFPRSVLLPRIEAALRAAQ